MTNALPSGRVGGVDEPLQAQDRALETVLRLHGQLERAGISLPLRLWNGQHVGPDDAGYRLALTQPWSLRAMLLPPTDLQMGESYLAGAVDVEGSMVTAMRQLVRLRDGLTAAGVRAIGKTVLGLPRPSRLDHSGSAELRGRRHGKSRDAAAIRHHYDVGDELFHHFLDRDLVYSCAYFSEEDRDAPVTDRAVLDRAQQRKMELICRKLELKPGERFLDVGCGWGSLVIHAARHHQVDAVGITLSENQATTARRRVAEAGLEDRVRIELLDYRDVTETFDGIASVGMVEHVGAERLDAYAAQLYDRLAPGGRLLNHGITTGQRDVVRDLARSRNNFVARYVFPDGALVPAYRMAHILERAGFELWDLEQLRPHYARTLEHWVANLEGSYDEVVGDVGERIARIWRAYLAGSVLGFERGDLGVVQILATRRDARLRLDRDHLADVSTPAPVGSAATDGADA